MKDSLLSVCQLDNSRPELTINLFFLGQLPLTCAFHILVDSPAKHSISGYRLHARRERVSIKIMNLLLRQNFVLLFLQHGR